MNIKQALCIGMGVVILCMSSVTAKPGWEFVEQTYITSDGLLLHAWLGIPIEQGKAEPGKHPLYLLLPMMGQTHDSYQPFIKALSSYAPSDSSKPNCPLPYLLSFDLRGHGKSTSIKHSSISFQTMGKEEFAKMPRDVKEMTEHIISDSSLHIDQKHIVAIGASIGANTAIMLTRVLPGITKVVMLSPGIDYRGLRPVKALQAFTGKSLIMVGKQDTYSASSSHKLAAANKNCQLQVYDGKDHGTNIINNNPEAMETLLKWLCGE